MFSASVSSIHAFVHEHCFGCVHSQVYRAILAGEVQPDMLAERGAVAGTDATFTLVESASENTAAAGMPAASIRAHARAHDDAHTRLFANSY